MPRGTPLSTRAGAARKRGVAALIATVLFLGSGPVPPGVDRAAFEEVSTTIKCDCGCHPQSVYDCACGRAAQMREEIAAKLRGGQSAREVIDAYVALKGEQIRIAPTASGFNLVAWVGPIVLLILASAGVVLVLRRWRPTVQETAAEPEGDAPDPDDPYVERLKKQLEEYP